jgi:hypothetical protein
MITFSVVVNEYFINANKKQFVANLTKQIELSFFNFFC